MIGYTGEGGNEYWKKPIFNKIETGDIREFGQRLIYEIKNYNKNWIKNTSKHRKILIKKYSDTYENKSLLKLSKKIQKYFS